MTDAEREAFAKLLAVCRRLRGPGGCPWDREQTLESMTPYLTEEAAEAVEAIGNGDRDHAVEELGDLLFAVVNLSRKLGVDPERELRATLHRFRDRFRHIERRLAEQGRTPAQSSLQEMDTLWEEAKRLSRAGSAAGETP